LNKQGGVQTLGARLVPGFITMGMGLDVEDARSHVRGRHARERSGAAANEPAVHGIAMVDASSGRVPELSRHRWPDGAQTRTRLNVLLGAYPVPGRSFVAG